MVLRFLRGASGAAALAAFSAPAFAHATLAVPEASPNSTYRGVVRIGHGCAGSPTRAVTVEIPPGFINAKPMPKPGWTVTVRKGPYGKAHDDFGKPMSEGALSLTWSGASLPDDHYDEFVFVARVTGDHAPGSVVPVPIVQDCETGAHRWTEVPRPGQAASELKEPAPTIRIAQAAGPAAPAAAATSFKAGALTIERPWVRATPGGAKVAAGYLRVVNAGPEPDRLVAASAPFAPRTEVHEMSTAGGVMTMREVPGGLVVPAGGAVELKPGGYHLMFMDLAEPVREGGPIRGTLTFEKAGTVAVSFEVTPPGARGPAAAGGHVH